MDPSRVPGALVHSKVAMGHSWGAPQPARGRLGASRGSLRPANLAQLRSARPRNVHAALARRRHAAAGPPRGPPPLPGALHARSTHRRMRRCRPRLPGRPHRRLERPLGRVRLPGTGANGTISTAAAAAPPDVRLRPRCERVGVSRAGAGYAAGPARRRRR